MNLNGPVILYSGGGWRAKVKRSPPVEPRLSSRQGRSGVRLPSKDRASAHGGIPLKCR